MKYAYADPPYMGLAHYYKKEPEYSGEIDYPLLIQKLETYDGWALSLYTNSLKHILPMCPTECRIMAWVKPFCSFKPGVNPAYAWEPVIVKIGRKRTREQLTVRDWVSVNITLKKGLTGAKPRDFCLWLFEILNLQEGDEFDDLYPGTGIVSETWKEVQSQLHSR